ncbi:MAG: hypothetical protein AUG51_12015 [Acidobacteria bacterium 13_1_20CM_3_53_8]|nr:MAG: hypothetical protein AUG51_12015 [Acidobacteria bacterium 13_1_20CM_3_53_8]
MAATKRGSKKGAAKKGASKKGGAKKGAAKKGGQTRGFLSDLGSIASTVGGIAGSVGAIAGSRKELRVAVPRNAGINDIVAATKLAFRNAGCPGCKSGFEKITLQDISAGGGG